MIANTFWDHSLLTAPVAAGPPGPETISGLKLWLKPSTLGGSDGDRLAAWNDSSGQGNHLSQTSAPAKPTLRTNLLNGYSGVEFGISLDTYFVVPAFFNAFSAAEIIIIMKVNDEDVGLDGTSHIDFTLPDDNLAYPYSDHRIYEQWGRQARHDYPRGSTTLEDWHAMEMSTALGAWSAYQNGIQIKTTVVNLVTWYTAGINAYIGKNISRMNKFSGWMTEICMYDKALDGTERDVLRDYFNDKYGLSIS